jgi:hypothetical protein
MARPNPIRAIMAQELPSITYQRRKSFRPTNADVTYAYNIINRYVFDSVLTKPVIQQGRIPKCWGTCYWLEQEQNTGSWCRIKLVDKWFCEHWFMNTLAHEMVHQYQWDIDRWEHIEYYGRDIHQNSGGHGPSFYEWRERFAHYGLNLKISFGQKRWFKHQNFNKC